MGIRAIALRKTVKNLHQPCGKEGIAAEASLATEQVEFDQQLIHHPPVEGRDHVGEGAVEGALAVGNGEGCAHAKSGSGWVDPSCPGSVGSNPV